MGYLNGKQSVGSDSAEGNGNLRQDVDHHPTDQHKFTLEKEDYGLERVNTSYHADGDVGDGTMRSHNMDDQVHQVDDGCGQNLVGE